MINQKTNPEKKKKKVRWRNYFILGNGPVHRIPKSCFQHQRAGGSQDKYSVRRAYSNGEVISDKTPFHQW